MLRVSLIVLLLAGAVCAEPEPDSAVRKAGSWKATCWGTAPTASKLPEGFNERKKATRNEMFVFAGATASLVDANLTTSLTEKDQKAKDDDSSTAWFGLAFAGSGRATDHTWSITTTIKGSGTAHAYSNGESSTWSESLQLIQISGDNTNTGGGQLAVEANEQLTLSISLPKTVRITFPKSSRTFKSDSFTESNTVTTSGSGKCCRIRVKSTAEAKGQATSIVSTASTWILASMDAEITMEGTAKIFGIPVVDRFCLTDDPDDKTAAAVTPPTGGCERGGNEAPTDSPTDEERKGDEEEKSPIDAGDLWKILQAEEEALLEADAKLEGE